MNLREEIANNWDLSFISVDDFFEHVSDTLEKIYEKKSVANLKEFNKSIIDPTKMIFDTFTNKFNKEELINAELSRQVDKSITNIIGYFHQNMFKKLKGWNVPKAGFDVENVSRNIYGEMKNKHNTMNSSSSQKTYMKLQKKILKDSNATCYLIEIIAKKSQDINWRILLDGEVYNHDKIRRISIDKFYALATGDEDAFKKICEWLPIVILTLNTERDFEDTAQVIIDELSDIDKDFIDSIYKLSYPTYNGFDHLNIRMKSHLNKYN